LHKIFLHKSKAEKEKKPNGVWEKFLRRGNLQGGVETVPRSSEGRGKWVPPKGEVNPGEEKPSIR